MDQSNETISDLVKIDGLTTTLTLTYAGKLSWNDGDSHRSLTIEKEVLGFSIQGSRIFVNTVVVKSDASCCFGGKGALVRKNFVFEPLSESSLQLWSNMIRQKIDSLGDDAQIVTIIDIHIYVW